MMSEEEDLAKFLNLEPCDRVPVTRSLSALLAKLSNFLISILFNFASLFLFKKASHPQKLLIKRVDSE